MEWKTIGSFVFLAVVILLAAAFVRRVEKRKTTFDRVVEIGTFTLVVIDLVWFLVSGSLVLFVYLFFL